ncbi:MAG: CatB-related O-acetyltransferase, partial [Bacilli bacterium]|nr:CatB-related O-acetyltransferase [Bacilli bacterium]
ANHFMNGFTTYPFNIFSDELQKHTPPLDKMPIKGDTVIGNDVWIGQNVTILPGVHIGDGAIIGANSVVGSNIPPYSIAVGNPCRVIKKRFNDDTIDKLLELKWWDYPIKTIEKNIDILFGDNIEALIDEFSFNYY